MSALVTVTVHQSTKRWPLKRPQRWYWVAKAQNGQVLAQSEMYTNQRDAWGSARMLFDPATIIRLRSGDKSSTIRRAP